MQPFFSDYFTLLQDLHTQIEKDIEGLPVAALDWTPGKEMNSLCVLATHVAGSGRYWIGEVVGRDPAHRDRDAEFRTQGVEASVLKKRLADSLAHARGVLETLTLEDLAAARASSRHGHDYTVGWVLGHVLEHTGTHLGHIQVGRQLWEQRHV